MQTKETKSVRTKCHVAKGKGPPVMARLSCQKHQSTPLKQSHHSLTLNNHNNSKCNIQKNTTNQNHDIDQKFQGTQALKGICKLRSTYGLAAVIPGPTLPRPCDTVESVNRST